MQVLYIPPSLKRRTTLLHLFPIIWLLQLIWVSRAPRWELPWLRLGVSYLAAEAVSVALLLGFRRGKVWAPVVFRSLLVCWVSLTLLYVVRERSTGLALMAVGLLALGAATLWLLRMEWRRSYFDPRVRWFEGVPQAMPGIACSILDPVLTGLRVARLDREGAFVFGSPGMISGEFAKARSLELLFTFRERTVTCRGRPIRLLRGNAGLGIAVEVSGADSPTQWGAFIEAVQGEGYA